MNNKTFYVTTPIFYPSGKLHIGHIYTASIAQIMANYKKMQGYETLFLTGVDEHGQKIEQKAIEENITPQKYVNKMTDIFVKMWKKMEIEYDIYMRTTSDFHEKTIQKIFTKLFNEGIIYKSQYEGLYSVQDEEFFTKTQAIKIGKKYFSPISNHELKIVHEETYFFKMKQFGNWLINYFKDNPDFIYPKKIVKELNNNFLKKGLEDLSITRTSFTWGIPTIEDSKHVIYVWIDALNNYITALGYLQKDDSKFKKFWLGKNSESLHIIGKEITRFHCIYWPIILKTLNLPLPTNILSHGWIVTKTGKMSKSKGNVIDPLEIIKEYSPEILKYYLVSQIIMGEDGTFDEGHLKTVYNADLANNCGNLFSRTIAMSLKNFEKSPNYVGPFSDKDIEIENKIKIYFEKYVNSMNHFNIPDALKQAIKLSKSLNKYIDETMPWTLKNEKNSQLESILNHLLNGIYAVGAMLSPILPKKMKELLSMLGLTQFKFENILIFEKFNNTSLRKGKILFERKKLR